MQKETVEKVKQIGSKTFSVVCIICIVILSVFLAGNLTIIIKGAIDPETPPAVFGMIPLIVTSGSMDGEKDDSFPAGAVVIMTKTNDPIELGDVVAFRDPTSKKLAIVSHRVVREEIDENGVRLLRTQGDANNSIDSFAITEDDVIGVYAMHINNIGKLSMFLKEPIGMLIFMGVPIIAFVVYDVVRRKLKKEKEVDSEKAEMAAELERLRALAGEAPAPDEQPAPESPDETQTPSE